MTLFRLSFNKVVRVIPIYLNYIISKLISKVRPTFCDALLFDGILLDEKKYIIIIYLLVFKS